MREKRGLRRLSGKTTVAALLAAGSMLAPLSRPAAALNMDPCKECHEEVAAAFVKSFHGRIWEGGARAGSGCQSCHGPADRHVDNPSRQTIISFGRGSVQSAEEQSSACLSCHASSSELTYWDMGGHKKNEVACVACHRIHQARATVGQPEVCFTCHQDVRADAEKQSHHPIVEGKLKCSDCHNTHGTLSHHLIKAENTNQLCYQCHADKRGPFIWEHPPVAENCGICHLPHGSRHESLMVEKVNNLCNDCHDDDGHRATAIDATVFFGGVNEDRHFLARGCVECHHSIHGSANFQNRFFRN